jgi:hypothetical protein
MPKAEDFDHCRTFYQNFGTQKQSLDMIEYVLTEIMDIVSERCWKDGKLTDFGRACHRSEELTTLSETFRDLMKTQCYSAAKLRARQMLSVYRELAEQYAV